MNERIGCVTTKKRGLHRVGVKKKKKSDRGVLERGMNWAKK